MRIKKLIKHFDFLEINRNKIALGPGVRLSPNGFLTLESPYSTDDDLYAETSVWNPKSVKQWLSFEVIADHGYDYGNIVKTSLAFRLSDGTDEYWWNGVAWEVNDTSWNSEAEVANHIIDFPVIEQKIKIIINLKTTDSNFAPVIKFIKILWASDIEWQEDLIFRSLVRDLREKIRPISDYKIKLETSTDTINLSTTYKIETTYNIVDIDSVYNDSDDPKHLNDLLLSFNSSTLEITLTSVLPAGTEVFIRFIYEPEITVASSEDYKTLAKIPYLVIDEISIVGMSALSSSDHVLNKDTGAAITKPSPMQGDVEFILDLVTDKEIDLQRLSNKVDEYIANNSLLRSSGLDEEFTLMALDRFRSTTPSRAEDLHSASYGFIIKNVKFYLKDARDSYGVKRFILTGDLNTIIE